MSVGSVEAPRQSDAAKLSFKQPLFCFRFVHRCRVESEKISISCCIEFFLCINLNSFEKQKLELRKAALGVT